MIRRIFGRLAWQAILASVVVFGFALPALVVYAFVGPSAVRRTFGNLLPAPQSPGPSREASAQPGDELSPG